MQNYYHKEGIFEYVWMENDKQIRQIVEFTNELLKDIDNKEIFMPDTYEDLHSSVSNHGKILGVFVDDVLVGYRYMHIPKDDENLANDVSLFRIEPSTVVHHESVMIRKEFRGNNLQNTTRTLIEKYLEDKGYSTFMSTVSPNNPPSYKNTLKNNFIIVALKKKYPNEHNKDGSYRFIFYKDNSKILSFSSSKEIALSTDFNKIHFLLDNNFVGVDYIDDSIIFKKLR